MALKCNVKVYGRGPPVVAIMEGKNRLTVLLVIRKTQWALATLSLSGWRGIVPSSPPVLHSTLRQEWERQGHSTTHHYADLVALAIKLPQCLVSFCTMCRYACDCMTWALRVFIMFCCHAKNAPCVCTIHACVDNSQFHALVIFESATATYSFPKTEKQQL